jgi:hypothetical protein
LENLKISVNYKERLLKSQNLKSGQQTMTNTRYLQQTFPKIDTPFLMIKQKRITTDYQATIRHQATTLQANEYLKDKYTWSEKTLNNIHWESHGKAMNNRRGRKQKTTTQFIHQWLPVNSASFRALKGTARLCPYCNSHDYTHFLGCQH